MAKSFSVSTSKSVSKSVSNFTLQVPRYGTHDSVSPPTTYLTNGPWIYMVPQFKPESVLMLGYAGGTVAGLIRLLYGDVPITGVDIESCKNRYNVDLIQVDAKEYIKTCKHFDVVIVDLFSKSDMCEFVTTTKFVDDLSKIANYIIVDTLHEANMLAYMGLKRFGSNKPNRSANKIYYFGTKDYNHLILR